MTAAQRSSGIVTAAAAATTAPHGHLLSVLHEGGGVQVRDLHRQALGGISAPGRQGMEAVAHFEGGSGAFRVELAVISVPSRSMTSQPASGFPVTASHGNPAGLAQISDHTCTGIAARARAILSKVRGSASSSVRRTVVSPGAAPKTGS